MGPKGPLLWSQDLSTCSCPEPDQFSPCLSMLLLWHSLWYYPCIYKGLPTDLFPSGFTTKTLYASPLYPICTTCPIYLILLDLITWIVFGEECKLWNSSFYHFLQSCVASALWVPTVFHSTLFLKTFILYSISVKDKFHNHTLWNTHI